MKILAIQFAYLGDTALMTPALRAMKEHAPDCTLHVLVAEEVVPVLDHLPCIDRLWSFPRVRGKANFRQSWPVIRGLRRERFDRSVDFRGSDRSAFISLLCGAPMRLAPLWPGGFLGRRFCYSETVVLPDDLHHTLRGLRLLSAWGIPTPASLELEIHADPNLSDWAAACLPRPAVLCHLATSQPKKEWPATHWARLFRMAAGAGIEMVFSTGVTPREQSLLEELKALAPEAPVLPNLPNLATFLAVLRRAGAFVSGDTGPLHFAAGLKVPTVALFGATRATLLAPFGHQHQVIQAGECHCDSNRAICTHTPSCMSAISPETVLHRVRRALSFGKREESCELQPSSAVSGQTGDVPRQ